MEQNDLEQALKISVPTDSITTMNNHDHSRSVLNILPNPIPDRDQAVTTYVPNISPSTLNQQDPVWTSYVPNIFNFLDTFEQVIKKASYVAIVILVFCVAVGYVFAQPGSNVKIKWKRSFKKLVC